METGLDVPRLALRPSWSTMFHAHELTNVHWKRLRFAVCCGVCAFVGERLSAAFAHALR